MVFAVRLHQTGCLVIETATILAELGVERSYGAVWNLVCRLADSGCDQPTAQPSRVAVNETAVKSTVRIRLLTKCYNSSIPQKHRSYVDFHT